MNDVQRRTITVRDAVLALCGMMLTFGLVVATIIKIDNREEKQRKQEQVDTDYKGCLRFNDTRLLIRDILNDFTDDSGQTQFDVTQLPQFQRIDDIDMQELLIVLLSPSGGSTSRREAALARTGTRSCEEEFPNHTPGIGLDPLPPPPDLSTTSTSKESP